MPKMTSTRLFLFIAVSCFVAASAVTAGCQDSAGTMQWKIKKFAVEERRPEHMGHGWGVGKIRDRAGIFVIDTPSSSPRRLAWGRFPALSSDGKMIAYCTWTWDDRGQLQIIGVDGSGRRNLARADGGACDPDWSPDGKNLAVTIGYSTKPTIAVIEKDGENLTRIADGEHPRWSPNGKQLAFCRSVGHNSIWTINADGTGARKLWEGDTSCPTWLPDGKGLAFSQCKIKGAPFPTCRQSAIFRIQPDGTGLEEIASDEPFQSWDLESYFSAEQRVALDLDTHRGTMNVPHTGILWENVSFVWEPK